MCSDAWKCVAQLAVKRLIYLYTWNLLMQSMVLQIMGSNYHSHLKYFGITDGIKKLCKLLLFKYVFDFAMIHYFLSYFNLKWSRDFLDTLYIWCSFMVSIKSFIIDYLRLQIYFRTVLNLLLLILFIIMVHEEFLKLTCYSSS